MLSFRYCFIAFLLLLACSCNKTSTVTVNVQQQSAGQPVKVSVNLAVLLLNISNRNDFKIATTSSAGAAVFNDVHAASYVVSAQIWDGSKVLTDSAFIEVKNGKSVEAGLLLH